MSPSPDIARIEVKVDASKAATRVDRLASLPRWLQRLLPYPLMEWWVIRGVKFTFPKKR